MEKDGAVAVQNPVRAPRPATKGLGILIRVLVREAAGRLTPRYPTPNAHPTSCSWAPRWDKVAAEPHASPAQPGQHLHIVCPFELITDLLVPVYSRHNSQMPLNRRCSAEPCTVAGRLGEERSAQFGVRGKRRAFRHPWSSTRERISQRSELRPTHIGTPVIGRHKGVQCVGL